MSTPGPTPTEDAVFAMAKEVAEDFIVQSTPWYAAIPARRRRQLLERLTTRKGSEELAGLLVGPIIDRVDAMFPKGVTGAPDRHAWAEAAVDCAISLVRRRLPRRLEEIVGPDEIGASRGGSIGDALRTPRRSGPRPR